MRPTMVVVDTTELKEAPRLDRGGWPQLLAWVRAGIIGGAVTEVVLLEANRHYARQRQEDLQKLRQGVKRLDTVAAVNQFDLDAVADELRSDVAGYLDWLRSKLRENGFETWSIPEVSHREVLARDLAERKPFNITGKGYRDALIWESVLEHLPFEQLDAVVLLVTRNSKDFATKEGSLDSGLLAEAAAKGGEVVRVDSLKSAIDLLREDVEEEMEALLADAELELPGEDLTASVADAVVGAAEQLAGTAVADSRHSTALPGLDVEVPGDIEGPEVTEVMVAPETVILDVYDRYDGDTLALAASVEATLTIEGFAYKADYYAGLDDEVDLVDDDWNDHMVLVQFERQFRLLFNVLTVANQVENVTFDVAEPI